jgi:hypothetical protein
MISNNIFLVKFYIHEKVDPSAREKCCKVNRNVLHLHEKIFLVEEEKIQLHEKMFQVEKKM